MGRAAAGRWLLDSRRRRGGAPVRGLRADGSGDARVIRVGAVGCGGHATSTIWPLLPSAGLQCVAAWSRSRERVEAAAAQFGIPHAYTDLEEILDESHLDGIVVVVPPGALGPLV